MKKYYKQGFTLIELTIFIVIISILATTILFASNIALSKGVPSVHKQTIAMQTVVSCLDWYVGQRTVVDKGYDKIITSPTIPKFCIAPVGYSTSITVSPTTIAGDVNYKTVTITVGGLGENVSASVLFADY